MTIINDRALAPDELFSKPGTTSSGLARPTGKQFICSLLMAGAAASTLTVVSPADALAMRPFVEARTLPARPPAPPAAEPATSVTSLLTSLRRVSGLAWGEMAAALGVSRRTIHNWLGGARLAGHHLTRLMELEQTVNAAATGSADDTRARLMQRGPQGRSILEDLALAARPARRVPLSSVPVGEMLTPLEVESNGGTEAAVGSQRRSSLRGGALQRRRPDES